MEDLPEQGNFWTQEWVPRSLVAYLLDHYSVLLVCEGKHHKWCVLKIGLCGYYCEDAMATAECDIFEAERCTVVLGDCVLYQVEEEEVCDYDNVTFGLEEGIKRCI